MKKREAVEEFDHILPTILKEYGSDEDSVREEIWELYLNHLSQEGRVNYKQKMSWMFPMRFRKVKNSVKNVDPEYIGGNEKQ